ncbi:Tyrosine recombinase XerD [Aeoliella mucimassa]|uniref:Tyrosine recombinase XerD n=1 Tax=Aeoliella mucimassa TaxID=2527972 RepID=A0A518AS13_9BACT|nr:Tyrosine recombinase XerD [Aeoliella mucimassa]
MASVFKRGRDKGKKNAVYYFSYDDHEGKRRTKKGYTDKGLTQQLAAKYEREAMLRKRGLIDPEDERRLKVKMSPIEEHLQEFEESLSDNTPKHVKLTIGRIRRVIEAANATTLSSLRVDTIASALRQMKRKQKFGNRTYNHYVQAIDGFCNWLVDMGRLDRNPLVALERLNTQVDVRHKRRALTPDEFAKLLKSARESTKTVQGYPGPMRAQVYLLSYLTGLRRKELASLTSRSFELEVDQPVLRVEAACSKHRREDVLPLHPELVALLEVWLDGVEPDALLFPNLDRKKTWLMVKTDLEAADIPYTNEQGTADFHAAGRHTHITELLRNGATLAEARELARHTDVRQTMKYTHIRLPDQAKALSKLPLPNVPEEATEGNWQRIGSGTGVSSSQPVSNSDNGEDEEDEEGELKNPCDCRGYVISRQPKSSSGTQNDKWRRRESNPRPVISPRKLLRVCPTSFDFARWAPRGQGYQRTSQELI